MPVLKIIAVVFWITGILVFLSDYLEDKRCTVETPAVIVDVIKETHLRYGSHAPRRQVNNYYPTIEFSVPGKTVRVKTRIKGYRSDTFKPAEQLNIRYNPKNPADLKLQEYSLLEGVIGMVIMILLGVVFFYISMRV